MKGSFLKVDVFIQPPEIVDGTLSSHSDLPIKLYAYRKDTSRTPEGRANLISIGVEITEKTFRGRFDVYAKPGKL
jgi:hypothetical protein